MTRLRTSAVKVTGRHRKDLGDLTSLQESIERIGLLHPIVVTSDGTLIAGQRRLVACQELGWNEIPVHVVGNLQDAASKLRAERDENTCRLNMSPSEKVALGRELEKLERPAAEERRAATLRRGSEVPDTESLRNGRQGETREIVGEAIGMSGPTYQRAKAVVAAAEEDPERFGDLKERMDETGKVSGVHDELQSRRRPNRSAPSNPNGRNGRERAGSRTVKQAVSSLRQAAISVDSAAAGFDMDAFGDISVVVAHPDAQEWIDLLLDATQRLSGHVRTLKRYRNDLRPEEATP